MGVQITVEYRNGPMIEFYSLGAYGTFDRIWFPAARLAGLETISLLQRAYLVFETEEQLKELKEEFERLESFLQNDPPLDLEPGDIENVVERIEHVLPFLDQAIADPAVYVSIG